MTKVEAIAALMREYNGVITLELLYNEITKYYPKAKDPIEWKAGLRGVLYRDINKTFKKIDTSVYALIDYDERNLIADKDNNIVTEKEILTVVRTQQHKFRENLYAHLKFCPITLISDPRLLIASHIKPWCLSNNNEKLDVYNGFMLSPVYDKLFDSGLMTITPKKEIKLSPSLGQDTIKKLNITQGYCEKLPTKGREKYLEFHNEKIFLK